MSHFREPTADDVSAIRALTAESDLSYHQFTNIFMWRRVMNAKICLSHDALYVYNRYRSYPPSVFFPFCPKGEEEAHVHRLMAMLPEVRRFRPVTAEQAQILCTIFPHARVESIRNQWDYCYRATDLIQLAGRKYHTKKNHLNVFLSGYHWKWWNINAESDENDLALLRAASDRLDELDGSLERQEEHEANLELIGHVRAFSLKCGVITVDGTPVAYSIGEQITPDTALIHTEKADRDYRGAYAAINRMLVENAFSHLEWINREEDMGIEGLRKAKESYRPGKMNEVFEVLI